MKVYLVFSGLLCLLLLTVSPVIATRSLTITGNKSTLLGDEELTITASASGFTDGETIYVKGAFFQSGSTNYFGYTKNGDTWIKNSTANTSQRSVKIGEWDNTLIVKSDFSDSGYKGEGDYTFKVGFYYGSYSSVNWSTNILTVAINEPDPTATPTPSPTATPTPTNTPTPTGTPIPTATNTPLPTPTKTPTQIPSKTPTPTAVRSPTDSIRTDSTATGNVLGLSSNDNNPLDSSASTHQNNSLKPLIISFLFIGAGLALIALVLVWQKRNDMRLLSEGDQ